MNFCSQCGHPVELKQISGDHQARMQCTNDACGMVHYQNPKILVSCFATWEDKVLVMKRGTEPFVGKWAIPSGFMENDETLQEAAARELFEETHAKVDIDKMELYTIGSLIQMNQIYVVFRAPLLSSEFQTTEEASEIKLLSKEEFPWLDFAFQDVSVNVQRFYEEFENDDFGVYVGSLRNGENIITEVSHRQAPSGEK